MISYCIWHWLNYISTADSLIYRAKPVQKSPIAFNAEAVLDMNYCFGSLQQDQTAARKILRGQRSRGYFKKVAIYGTCGDSERSLERRHDSCHISVWNWVKLA